MKRTFMVPEKALALLEEVSGGAFLVFILDEDGDPVIYENHDSLGQESVVKNFAIDWLDADRQVRKEEMVDEIYENKYENSTPNGRGYDDEDDGDSEEWKK